MTAEKEALHFALEIREGSLQSLASRVDDDGPLWTQVFELGADGLTDAPLDTVAHNGFADGARKRKTDAGPLDLRLTEAEGREERSGEADPLVVDLAEIL